MRLIAACPHRRPVGQPQHQRFFDRGGVAIELAAQVGIIEHRPQRVFVERQGGARLQQRLLLLVGQPQGFFVGQVGSRLHLGEPLLDGGVGLLEQGDMIALALLAASRRQCRRQQARGRHRQAAEDQGGMSVTLQGQPRPGQAGMHLQCLQRRVMPMTVNGQDQPVVFQAQAPLRRSREALTPVARGPFVRHRCFQLRPSLRPWPEQA